MTLKTFFLSLLLYAIVVCMLRVFLIIYVWLASRKVFRGKKSWGIFFQQCEWEGEGSLIHFVHIFFRSAKLRVQTEVLTDTPQLLLS